VPQPRATGEAKTKPTQASVRELRGLGLTPDLIMCRSELPIGQEVKDKISNFCHVAPDQVICIHDLSSIYHVPILMDSAGVVDFLNERLQLKIPSPRPNKYEMVDFNQLFLISRFFNQRLLQRWVDLARRVENNHKIVTISLVGKYTKLEDSYASISKSLQHATIAAGYKLNLRYIEACNLERAMKLENPVLYHEAWQSLCVSE
jgi:CTP synthase